MSCNLYMLRVLYLSMLRDHPETSFCMLSATGDSTAKPAPQTRPMNHDMWHVNSLNYLTSPLILHSYVFWRVAFQAVNLYTKFIMCIEFPINAQYLSKLVWTPDPNHDRWAEKVCNKNNDEEKFCSGVVARRAAVLCVSSLHRSVSLHEGGGELQPSGDARPAVSPHTATESENIFLLTVYNVH